MSTLKSLIDTTTSDPVIRGHLDRILDHGDAELLWEHVWTRLSELGHHFPQEVLDVTVLSDNMMLIEHRTDRDPNQKVWDRAASVIWQEREEETPSMEAIAATYLVAMVRTKMVHHIDDSPDDVAWDGHTTDEAIRAMVVCHKLMQEEAEAQKGDGPKDGWNVCWNVIGVMLPSAMGDE